MTVVRALLCLCVVAGCAGTTRNAAIPLVTSSNESRVARIVGSPATKPPSTPPAPLSRRTVWVATTACLAPGDPASRLPSFDPKRCVGIIERVVVDANVSDADAVRVEKLSIESAALMLEALLPGGDVSEDSGD